MNSSTLISNGNLETEDIGKKISNSVLKKSDSYPVLIFLIGELGAGKTTLCKGFLKGLGHKDVVKSPCLLYTSPSPRDRSLSRMPSSA